MLLHELKKGDKFTIDGEEDSPIIGFDHVDGMYSVCYVSGEVVHLNLFTPVIKIPEESGHV